MEDTPVSHKLESTLQRAGHLFWKRLDGRPTLLVMSLVAILIAVALVALRNGTTWCCVGGSESTDDAYVRADQITLSSHLAGYVQSVAVQDNAVVQRGQLIATIRDDDYRAKLVGAEAALKSAEAAVEVLTDQANVQRQKVLAASAEVAATEADLRQAHLQHARQRGLIDDGTTSRRELESAEAADERLSALHNQKAAEFRAAKASLQVLQAQGTEAELVALTKSASLELARIDLGYTRILSPESGQLSERAALAGEYVTPGTKIGLLVPLPHVWVVANFRESQIARMYPGQSARISVDGVPGILFRGTVQSIAPASGALQALLPPDNATGNFTKIAQRFSVKVDLERGQQGAPRLRPGMSAIVQVTVGGEEPARGADP